MGFTETEKATLTRLLEKVRTEGYFWPDETTMRAAHATVSYWAPELVVLRVVDQQRQILLARYDGGIKEFEGLWHIPGGYNRWDETVEETCDRVSLREIGSRVTVRDTIGSYKWREGEHPYGRPLSLYVLCDPRGEIVESEKLRFFDICRLPENTIAPHRRFIEELG